MTNLSNKKLKLSGKEIRSKFIEFFEKKHNHKHLKSSSLIPDNPTVLLTPAGMLQFVPIFLGLKNPPSPPRAVTVQKCARAGGKDSDIENVGRTPRHHTFFEMLGNFSFGDYFKEDIIPWSWDFITNELKLEKDKLWITIFETDEESGDIWRDKVGVPAERILKKGRKENFWGPPGPTGPCGPCTEIHYDLGEQYKCSHPQCGIDTCECDRYVEIWNLVFMELYKDEEGIESPLKKKNVDTGMGLERITMVVNDLTSTFETDLLAPIVDKVCELSGKKYNDNEKDTTSIRIISDHARCVSFLISDGLVPGNEGRNYVLRMILRRALRHGKILGTELPFLYKIVNTVVDNYKETYPELETNKEKIISIIKREEERFQKTLGRGEALLDEIIEKSKQSKIISGEEAFKLYDTFGFPLELTSEMAEEQGFSVDIEGFNKAMKEQKERAKKAHKTVSLTEEVIYSEILGKTGTTTFTGYESTQEKSNVLSIIKENKLVNSAEEDDIVEIILDRTPFYAESGGQIGDTGILKSDNFEAKILNTTKFEDLFIHKAQIKTGLLNEKDSVEACVDSKRKKEIMIHHTTAHLLQSALKEVLGDEIAQAGSQVDTERTRFDFTFDRAMTEQELSKVESLLNDWINQNHKRTTIETSIEEAKKLGAIALFDEKYTDNVRVVQIGDISKELCGGTHVASTGEIRLCKIVSESAIAAGVRRIELTCGNSAFNYMNSYFSELNKIAKKLKTPPLQSFERIDKLQSELSTQQKAVSNLETQIAQSKVGNLCNEAIKLNNGKLLVTQVDGIPAKVLKEMVETLSDKLGESIIIFASVLDGKISILSKVSKDFTEKGANAGQFVNEIASQCDGRGGGRPNFAQAGAKDTSKLKDALASLEKQISEKY